MGSAKNGYWIRRCSSGWSYMLWLLGHLNWIFMKLILVGKRQEDRGEISIDCIRAISCEEWHWGCHSSTWIWDGCFYHNHSYSIIYYSSFGCPFFWLYNRKEKIWTLFYPNLGFFCIDSIFFIEIIIKSLCQSIFD